MSGEHIDDTLRDKLLREQACALLGDWKKKGYSSLLVSVNVSCADFYQSDLASVLQK